MTKPIRKVAMIALGATVALVLAACGSSGDSGTSGDTTSPGGDASAPAADASDAPAADDGDDAADDATASDEPSGEPVHMVLWSNATTGPGSEYFEKTIKAFEDANPNVTIDLQIVQNEDLDGKLQTALQGGEGSAPDIFLQRGGGKLADMVGADQVLDITDGIDAPDVSDGVFAAVQVDDRTYAMPVSVLPGGFWYSQDVFNDAGVSTPPTTLDELTDAIDKIKESGVAPIALGGMDGWPAGHWYYWFALRDCSQDALNAAATSLTFDDPCWLKAGEDLKAFADLKPFNEGFLTTSAQQGAGSSAGMIANHQAGAELMGAWDPGVIASLTPDEQPLPDLGYFPFVSVPGGEGDPAAIMGGVDAYSCSAWAPKDACIAFLNFLVTADAQEGYYEAFQAPPVNKTAQGVVTEPYLKTVIEAFNDAPYVSLWLDTLYGQDVGGVLNDSVVELLAGDGTPQDIVDAVNSAG